MGKRRWNLEGVGGRGVGGLGPRGGGGGAAVTGVPPRRIP